MTRRFHWIVENELAASEVPGLSAPLVDDLLHFIKEGVDTIVTLTEEPHPANSHLARRFDWVHFPINDFGVPDMDDTYRLILRMADMVKAGHKPLVHCLAGIGRTGTILACYLVYTTGQPAGGIIPWLRQIEPGYIQTRDQERFVEEFEQYVKVVKTAGD